MAHTGDAVAQVAAVAAIEIQQMALVQRQQVAWILDDDIVQALGRTLEVAGGIGGDGRRMHALALAGRAALQVGQHGGDLGGAGRLRPAQVQVGKQCTAHGEVGAVLQGRLACRQRVAPAAHQQAQRCLECVDGAGTGAVHAHAAMVGTGHRSCHP